MRISIRLVLGETREEKKKCRFGFEDKDSRMGSLGGGASIARKMSRKRWNFKPFGWRCLRREKVKNCGGILQCAVQSFSSFRWGEEKRRDASLGLNRSKPSREM